MAEVLHLDIYQILEKHQSLSNIQPGDFLNSEPFNKMQSYLANPSVELSLVRCLCNFSEEESGYSCEVEVELVRHEPSMSARVTSPPSLSFASSTSGDFYCCLTIVKLRRHCEVVRTLMADSARPFKS